MAFPNLAVASSIPRMWFYLSDQASPHAHAFSLQQMRPHTRGMILGLVSDAEGWNGGALPRWRPPLIPSPSSLGLLSQVVASPVRSGFLVLAFWVFHSLYNRGSFSSIRIDFCVEKLCPNSVILVALCNRGIKF